MTNQDIPRPHETIATTCAECGTPEIGRINLLGFCSNHIDAVIKRALSPVRDSLRGHVIAVVTNAAYKVAQLDFEDANNNPIAALDLLRVAAQRMLDWVDGDIADWDRDYSTHWGDVDPERDVYEPLRVALKKVTHGA